MKSNDILCRLFELDTQKMRYDKGTPEYEALEKEIKSIMTAAATQTAKDEFVEDLKASLNPDPAKTPPSYRK